MKRLLEFLFPKSCLGCGASGRYICKNCLVKVKSRGWRQSGIYSIFKYEGVIKKAILALKYKFAFDIARELAQACAGRLKSQKFRTKAVLVPIPLHKKRKNWRGFNQAEEVGKIIAQEMDWEFESKILVRKFNTPPQVGLRGRIRHENIRDAFELNANRNNSKATYLVFDDVVTTGSTILEAIKAFKREGNSKVFGLTIAS